VNPNGIINRGRLARSDLRTTALYRAGPWKNVTARIGFCVETKRADLSLAEGEEPEIREAELTNSVKSD
jgi:hypothetical protein